MERYGGICGYTFLALEAKNLSDRILFQNLSGSWVSPEGHLVLIDYIHSKTATTLELGQDDQIVSLGPSEEKLLVRTMIARGHS